MKIQKSLFIAILVVALAILTGCGHSTIMDYTRIVLCTETEAVDISGDSIVAVPIGVSNQSGASIFAAKAQEASYLAYHVMDMEGNPINNDGMRTPLPKDVNPRQTVEASLQINPADFQFEGEHFLIDVDLINENGFWFGDKGATTCRIAINRRSESSDAALPDELSAEAFSDVSISAESREFTIDEGGILNVPLVIENNSPFGIRAAEQEGFTLLSYHIMDLDGNELEHDGIRTPLPRDIGPGETIETTVQVDGSIQFEGERFLIDIDMVAENMFWYSEKGMPICRIAVNRSGEVGQATGQDGLNNKAFSY